LENSVQAFCYDIAEKGLTFGKPLAIDVSMQTLDEKQYLVISDNGPGISPSIFKEVLTTSTKPSPIQRTSEDLSEFDCSEHGMGFKLSALRLADTCLVISKHSIRNQLGI
jgi:hypothetical protein